MNEIKRIEINADQYNNSFQRLIESNIYPLNIIKTEGIIIFKHITFTTSSYVYFNPNAKRQNFISFVDCSFEYTQGARLATVQILDSVYPEISFSYCRIGEIQAKRGKSIEIKKSKISKVVASSTFLRLYKSDIDSLFISGIKLDAVNLSEIAIVNLRLYDCTIDKEYRIEGKRINELIIDSLNSPKGKLIFRKNYIYGHTSFKGIILENFKVQDNKSDTVMNFSEVNLNQLHFYRNRSAVDISNSKIYNGKVNLNSGTEFNFSNSNITNELIFEKNRFDTVDIFEQYLSNIKFSQNTGSISFKKIEVSSFPILDNNSFNEVSILDFEPENKPQWKLSLGNVNGKIIINKLALDYLVLSIGECVELSVNQVTLDLLQLDFTAIRLVKIYENKIKRLKLEGDDISTTVLRENIESVFDFQSKVNRQHIVEFSKNSLKEVEIRESSISEFNFNNNEVSQRTESFEFSKVSCAKLKLQGGSIVSLKFDECKIDSQEMSFSDYDHLTLNDISTELLEFNSPRIDTNEKACWKFDAIPKSDLTIQSCGIGEVSILQFNSIDIKNGKDEHPILNFNSNTINTLNLFYFNSARFRINDNKIARLSINWLTDRSNLASPTCIIENGSIEDIRIKNNVQADNFSLISTKVDKVRIEGSGLNELNVSKCESHGRPYDVGELIIRNIDHGKRYVAKSINLDNSNIRRLSFIGISPESMSIKNILVEYLSLQGFHNAYHEHRGSFEMSHINSTGNHQAEFLEISNCDLSGLNLNSCYFKSFGELIVKSSKLDEINCTATTWPTKVTSYIDETRTKLHHFEIREACRQLKLAMADHQDRVSELQFHALEMDAYRQIVTAKWNWNRNHLNDRLSLVAGWTNSFGLDWIKPLALIFTFLMIDYLLILFSQYNNVLLIWALSSEFQHFNWVDFFTLFNPTHRTDQLHLIGTISGWTAFLDFLSRIISAFFLYQIVAAFRKFRK